MLRHSRQNARYGSVRTTPFETRLGLLTTLDADDLAAIDALSSYPYQERARKVLVREGDRRDLIHVLLDGWACRYRLLPDGRRQITALLLPGDICDLDALHLPASDCALATLTPCLVATLPCAALRDLAAERPAIAATLGWLAAVEGAMLAERNAGLGRRSAREHLAHLLCELLLRQTVTGFGDRTCFPLPVTQEEIGDTIGLTAVHVNRMLQSLRGDGSVEQQDRLLKVADWTALRRAAAFHPGYLHLEGMAGRTRDEAEMP